MPDPSAVLTDTPASPWAASPPEHVDVVEDRDGWTAECLVCHSWISTHESSRGNAEMAFARHVQNDYPHQIDTRRSHERPPTT